MKNKTIVICLIIILSITSIFSVIYYKKYKEYKDTTKCINQEAIKYYYHECKKISDLLNNDKLNIEVIKYCYDKCNFMISIADISRAGLNTEFKENTLLSDLRYIVNILGSELYRINSNYNTNNKFTEIDYNLCENISDCFTELFELIRNNIYNPQIDNFKINTENMSLISNYCYEISIKFNKKQQGK